MAEFEAEQEFLEGVCERCQRALLDSLHEASHCGHCDCCYEPEYEDDEESR